MLTIDASVWVNADSPAEPQCQSSRAFLEQVAAIRIPIFVPTLLRVEVAAAISRTRNDPALAREFSEKLYALPFLR
jgi:predicted nucleic acid-binding protein